MRWRNLLLCGVTVVAMASGGAVPSFAAASGSLDPSGTRVSYERVSSSEAAPKFWWVFGRKFGRHATERHWRWVRRHTSSRSVFLDVKEFRKAGPYKTYVCGRTNVKSGWCEYYNYTGIDFRRRPSGRIVVTEIWID